MQDVRRESRPTKVSFRTVSACPTLSLVKRYRSPCACTTTSARRRCCFHCLLRTDRSRVIGMCRIRPSQEGSPDPPTAGTLPCVLQPYGFPLGLRVKCEITHKCRLAKRLCQNHCAGSRVVLATEAAYGIIASGISAVRAKSISKGADAERGLTAECWMDNAPPRAAGRADPAVPCLGNGTEPQAEPAPPGRGYGSRRRSPVHCWTEKNARPLHH